MRRIPRRGGKENPVYEVKTRGIVVRVATSYLPSKSDPLEGKHFWAYMVEIENHGDETVQLLSRHWVITDAFNRVEEIKGAGVVGEQPTLKPRDAFRYTSGVPLNANSGTMRGTYQMLTQDGDAFDAEIPEFSLDLPGARRVMN
jgi:ApaG protein